MNEGKGERVMVVMATILLALKFIWRLMPDDEVPGSTLNALSIMFELGMLGGVIGMVPRILRSLPEGAPRGGWIFLLVVAIVSGLGIFGLRIAGGPRVESSTSSSDSGLRHQVHEQIVALEKLSKKLAATRWVQTFVTQDPAKIRTLTRQDLQEQRALCAELRDCADRILKVFAEATAKGVAHSTLSDEPGATRPETWQKTREVYGTTYDYLGLIEQHWEEWVADPIPAVRTELKPWQVELRRLVDAAGTSAREAHVLLESKTPPSVAATELGKQLHDVVYLWGELNEKMLTTAWFKDGVNRRTLSRRDLQDVRESYEKLLGYADRAVTILTEAESKKIDISKAMETPAFARLDFWRAWLRTARASSEKLAVLDQNWDEYVAHPFPEAESDLKPWQREVRRLDEVAAAASKEMQALIRPPASPSPAVAEVTGLAKELRDLIASWITATEKFQATRWAKTNFEDPAQKKTLTRRDFEEAKELSRVAVEYQERISKLLAQAKSQGVDVSAATDDPAYLSSEFWRAFQEMYVLRLKYRKLIDQHWDEWLTTPEAVSAKSKPWQREMKRLDEEIEARRKKLKAYGESVLAAAASPTPGPARAPSPPANNFDQLALQTHMLPAVADYVTALKRLQATRWIKSPDANSYHPQKITQADLHDADAKLRELIAAIDKLRADLDAQTLPVPAAEKEYWRIKRETSVAFEQLTKLLEDNWKEWHVNGIEPMTGGPKPWQKEALRLQTEIDKLKQIEQTSILL